MLRSGMVATIVFVALGLSLIVLGWRMRDSEHYETRAMGAIFLVGGIWQLAGAPMWADMLMGTFR